MKKILTSFSGIFCIFLAVVFFLLTFSASGTTSSRYTTTATQYAEVSTVTPYVLSNEVKISFSHSDNAAKSQASSLGAIYSKSKYYESGQENYVLLEGVNNVTDYYGTKITYDSDSGSSTYLYSSDLSDFVDIYADTKDDSYGTLTYTGSSSTSYVYPLVIETTVGQTKGDTITTVNIAPMKTKVKMTVYFASKAVPTSSGDNMFYYNGIIVAGTENVTDGNGNITSYGYTEGTTDSNYAYTADTSSNTDYKLYTFTQEVDAEQAISITKGDNSIANVMIFLIVLEPDPISLTSSGNTISTNYTLTGTQDLAVAYDMGSISAVSAISGDDSIFTVSATGSPITLTPVALGTTTLTVTVEDTSGNIFTKTYNVTVANSVVLKNGGTEETSSYVAANTNSVRSLASSLNIVNSGETATYSATSSDENVATVSIDSSLGKVTISSVNSGVATISVTATVTDSSDVELYTCTTDYTVYVEGYYIAADTNMVVVDGTLKLALCNITNSSVKPVSGVTWESSNGNVATVDLDGVVTGGESVGTATITASYSGVTLTFDVTVYKEFKATYTINSSANGAKDTSAFDVSYSGSTDSSNSLTVSGAGSSGIKYTNDEDNYYSEYSGYSNFSSSRYAVITANDNVIITSISVYAYTSNTSRILYISTTAPSDTSGKEASSENESNKQFTLTASDLSTAGQDYYIWATGDVRVYAIVIEYKVTG